MNKPIILKENRVKQRADVTLSKDIATALLQKIFLGETLFPPSNILTLAIEKQEGEIETINLSTKTLNAWVSRNNVIPETGKTLRDLLNEAREAYRNKEREKRQNMVIDIAEKEVHRTMNLRTNIPVVGMFGVLKDKDGNIVRKENHNLLRVKMDTAKFLLERLDPAKYGAKTDNKHTVMTFSLAELRKAKEQHEQSI